MKKRNLKNILENVSNEIETGRCSMKAIKIFSIYEIV